MKGGGAHREPSTLSGTWSAPVNRGAFLTEALHAGGYSHFLWTSEKTAAWKREKLLSPC